MEFEDFVEPEIAVTAAVSAAIFSPKARKVMRKGLVYGMAGVLAAGDMVTSFARSVGQGMQQVSGEAAHAAEETDNQLNEVEKGPAASKEAEATTSSRRRAAPKTEGKSV